MLAKQLLTERPIAHLQRAEFAGYGERANAQNVPLELPAVKAAAAVMQLLVVQVTVAAAAKTY